MTTRSQRPGRSRQGTLAVGFATAALVLSLSACGAPARDLPERPPLADQQAIDLCALVPAEQLAEISDALGRGSMSQKLGDCEITSAVTGFGLSLAPDELPDVVADEDPDAAVAEVEGGLVIDSAPNSHCTERTLVSDTGYVIEVTGVAHSLTECPILDDLGRLVLRNLAADVPTIDWPDGSAGRTDLCAAVEEAGIGEALGIEDSVSVRSANHADCTVGDSWDVAISFNTRMPTEPERDHSESEIGGQSALSSDDGCRLWVDLGGNPVLAELLEGGRDVLAVSTASADVECAALPAAVEPLVLSLVH